MAPVLKTGEGKTSVGSNPTRRANRSICGFGCNHALVAQLEEQRTFNPRAEGSSPSGRTRYVLVVELADMPA